MRSATQIYNSAAGRFPAEPLIEGAACLLNKAGWTTKVKYVYVRDDLERLSEEAIDEGQSAVFVIGGDGSVGTIAASLSGSDTALSVLPAGTANVWAKELGLRGVDWFHRQALDGAAAGLAEPDVRLIDGGEINGRKFLLWGGVGLDAAVVSRVEPRERWQKALAIPFYTGAALYIAFGWRGIELRVEIGGVRFEGRYMIAIASNIPSYAGGLIDLAEEAKIDDGLLDFWLIQGDNFRDVISQTYSLLRGSHKRSSSVDHLQSDHAIFHTFANVPVLLDGETMEMQSPLEFKVHKQVLKILVPRELESGLFMTQEVESLDHL
ncbi:MAG: diacylglycerol kinase family protein [Anaerolineales bacterium]